MDSISLPVSTFSGHLQLPLVEENGFLGEKLTPEQVT